MDSLKLGRFSSIPISESNLLHLNVARILRLLATNHVFTEISPNRFTNNRLSSAMDTKKPSSDVLAVELSKRETF